MTNTVKSMYDMLEATASDYPNHVSLDYYGKNKTFAQLIKEVRTAAACLNKAGIGPGDRVIICLPNIPQTVVFFYALNFLGAVPCMVHPLSTTPELKFYINLTQSKHLLALDINCSAYAEGIKSILSTVITTSAGQELPWFLRLMYWLKQGRKRPRISPSKNLCWDHLPCPEDGTVNPYTWQESQPALILFSGGTSGSPKAVLLSNGNMNALASQVLYQIEPDPSTDAMLCILPFFHGFGLGVCMHPVLLEGGRCILIPRFSKTEFAKVIMAKRPSYIAGVPTLFQAMLDSPKLANVDMGFLKAAFCGGDATPPALIHRFNSFVRARGGNAALREGYGLTECVTACSVMPAGEYRQGSAGLPFAGTKIKIVDQTLTELPPGRDGEICISGPTVMLGYLGGEEVLKTHSDGLTWLHTGDIGSLDEGGYLYFRQRIKRIIKRSGYTVYPSQVEAVINSHPLVANSCVIGVPDQYAMQKIKAFVVYKGPIASAETMAEEIKHYISEKLIKWAVPSEIEFCTELPVTRLGKVAFSALEDRERDGFTPEAIPLFPGESGL